MAANGMTSQISATKAPAIVEFRNGVKLRLFFVREICACSSLSSALEKYEDLFVFFGSEIGADAHVHCRYLPLRRTVYAR